MLNDIAYNIILKQGTAANLALATTYLQQGELAYTTDGKIVYVTDGANNHLPVAGVMPFVSKSGNYTLKLTDYVVVFTATATASLPLSMPTGKVFRVKLTGTGTLTIQTISGAALIDGQASITISTQYQSVDLIFDGTNWNVF